MAPKQTLAFGKFSKNLSGVLAPGTKKPLGKAFRKAGMNPNDPLNLAHEKQMKNAAEDAKTAEEQAEEMRQQQMVASAELDDEENKRIKKLLSGSRGVRGFRGGSMFRGRPSNTAGRSAASAAGGSSASTGSAAMRNGGRAGGLGSFKYASERMN